MSDFWSQFAQTMLMAIAPIIAVALATWLIGMAKAAWQRIKTEQPDLGDKLEWLAKTAVKAAEQAGAANLITEKKKYAIDYVQSLLVAQGWKIDVAAVEAAIEAAVYDLNKDKPKDVVGYDGIEK